MTQNGILGHLGLWEVTIVAARVSHPRKRVRWDVNGVHGHMLIGSYQHALVDPRVAQMGPFGTQTEGSTTGDHTPGHVWVHGIMRIGSNQHALVDPNVAQSGIVDQLCLWEVNIVADRVSRHRKRARWDVSGVHEHMLIGSYQHALVDPEVAQMGPIGHFSEGWKL